MNQARATSFSTLKDLRAYIKCLIDGGSPRHCLNVGDNGEGAWGDNMAQLTVPYVALPPSVGVHNKHLRVVLKGMGHEKPFECICGDKGPDGVIDLNPAALIAAGLPSDTELDCPAEWEWV